MIKQYRNSKIKGAVIVNMRIRTKLILYTVAIGIAISLIVGIVSIQNMRAQVNSAMTEKAKGDMQTGLAIIDKTYPGPWAAKDGVLYKGDIKLNDQVEIVDSIGALTGDTVTVFLGDTRIATNVQREGKRMVGTQASPEVVEKVLNKGEMYIGEANVVGENYQTAYEPIRNDSGNIIGMFYVGASKKFSDELQQQFMQKLAAVVGAIILVTLAMAFYIARRATMPILIMLASTQKVAAGDLTVEPLKVSSQDELGQLAEGFNKMVIEMRDLITAVTNSVEQVAASAEQLTASAEQSAQAASHIAERITEVAAGTERQLYDINSSNNVIGNMTSGINQIATNSANLSKIVDKTTEAVRNGDKTVNITIDQMENVEKTVLSSSEVVAKLGERSKEIGQIVTTISNIAGQTNLLALNAAIEAARAGEQGRGFSVVAEEVRKLAEQSQKAAKEISSLIGEIQNDTHEAILAMKHGTLEVKNGLEAVNTTGAAFSDITKFVGEMLSQINNISTEIQELAEGSHKIVATVEDIARVCQETAGQSQNVSAATQEQSASMQEVAASSQALAKMAEDLQKAVIAFKL